jgi:hypothetical protein
MRNVTKSFVREIKNILASAKMAEHHSRFRHSPQVISISFLDATHRPPQPPLVRGEQEKHL